MNESRANYVRLYKNHKKSIGYWEGWTEGGTIIMEFATTLGGSPQRKTEVITAGKQGRSVQEQAAFRLRSRAKGKIDGGYVATIAEAQNGPPTDANGQVKPMLAQSIKDYKQELAPERTYVQPKYNGHRCLMIAMAGTVSPLSRNGKQIPAVGHITSSMKLDDGMIVDGEIYRHGWPLQRIASAAKKLQADSSELRFIAYDLVDEERFSVRWHKLQALKQDGCLGSHCQLAPTKRLDEIDSLKDLLEKVRSKGYEGLIVRRDENQYEIGRRTNQLLKVKIVIDSEFKIVDVLASKDGWAIFVCELENGGTFKVSAPGGLYEKQKFLEGAPYWIGKYVTVEYSELTKDGVPFHPVATQIRSDL